MEESNPVCNHTSNNKIGRPRSASPICLSRVWLQTKLDDTKSYYKLSIKITISEKRRIPRYEKGKFALKVFTFFLWWLKPRLWWVDLNYNFECDWLIELSDNKLSDNRLSDNKLSDNNLTSELVENRSFLNQSQSRKL